MVAARRLDPKVTAAKAFTRVRYAQWPSMIPNAITTECWESTRFPITTAYERSARILPFEQIAGHLLIKSSKLSGTMMAAHPGRPTAISAGINMEHLNPCVFSVLVDGPLKVPFLEWSVDRDPRKCLEPTKGRIQ